MASGAAAETNRKSGNPPPVIGKAGRYTVFIKAPPPSPKPVTVDVESQTSAAPPLSQPSKPSETSPGSFYSMFSSAVTKIQNVHSAVDEYLADWFGLNQSKYQWALNEYFEAKEMEIGDTKPKEQLAKGQEMQQVDEQVMKRDDEPSP